MNNSSIKTIAKSLLPRWLVNWYYRISNQTIHFIGAYPNWQAAVKDAKGYDDEVILQQVIAKTKLVVTGEAAFERDGVVFDKPEYSYPLLALLLRAASENNNKLSVLDFGGSLGSTYFQCRSFLQGIDSLKWRVVEQSHFVVAGNTCFADDILSFYNTIADSARFFQPNVVLFSSVLQYLPEPFVILQEAISSKTDYIVIDRNPFIVKGDTALSLQKVPKKIVESSYPVWLFNEQELKQVFVEKYVEIASFDAIDGTIGQGRLTASFKGIIFKRIEKSKV